MGQFDSTKNATSIPYEIHVEQSIIDALQKLATTNTESPAAAGEAPVGVLPEAAEEVWIINYSLDQHHEHAALTIPWYKNLLLQI